MNTKGIVQVVDEFYSSCNEYDPDNTVNMFCNDATLKCTGVDTLSGDAIVEYIGAIMEACPGMKFSVREVTELKATGRATEEALVLWTGEIPDGVAGKEGMVIVDGIDRIQVKDGEILRIDSYFDRVPLAADLFLSTAKKASQATV